MEIIGLLLIGLYWYAGDQANQYLKYHILDVRAEFYGNWGDYMVERIIWATILGWATIPLALIHNYCFAKS